mmetsp:Transcript_46977/g.145118  ORF Transcript_46977/g.145118 Transcript_46977/m.145118 type:complete len:564 (-) Transcript_46977:91-1782(-)
MPIDPVKMRRATEHNEQVTEGVKVMSKRLEKLDPRSCEQTSATAKAWAQNVRELKLSLEEQQALSLEMRESARIQDEQHGESFRDKYRFLVGRLKADIRGFFSALQEFVDLPQDFANQRTWDHCAYDMETDIKHLSAINAGDNCLVNVDPIVMLLNYRDKVISLLLAGMLFQTAVLHWDLKSERAYADGPMVQMAEQVVNIFSKTESLPAKYRLTPGDNLPVALEPGPFTLDKRKQGDKGGAAELTLMQWRLLTVLREMQSLDKGLRNLKTGEQVHIADKNQASGKSAALDELQKEIKRWFDKCIGLERELSSGKGHRQTAFELQVEQLTAKCAEKDQQNKQHITSVHKLESDVQGWKYELANLRREKAELVERNAKMAKENLPVLEIDKLLSKSREAVERLSKDAEKLSAMFRLQVRENKKTGEDQEEISKELTKVRRQLACEQQNSLRQESELEKKETLYLRTMAARKCIHESYMEQKAQIARAEEQMREREAGWQEMLKVLEGRDSEIKQLQGDLRRAQKRIEELNQQKQMCMEAYEKATGRPGASLLQRFRPSPTVRGP